MEEIFSICDRISVLRDGLKVGETLRTETNVDAILRWMVGRDVHHLVERGEPKLGDVALDVNGLTRKPRFVDISLSVKAGEIVGLAGLVGAGRTDVLRAIFGLDTVDSGLVTVVGTKLVHHDPARAMEAGVALVPEDRQQHGVLMPQSIWENGSLAIMPRLAKFGLVDDKTARQKSAEGTQRLAVKMRDDEQAIRELSGGNQQKVVIGKWLLTNPKVLLLDEPTRGIDVGAKAEVHRVIVELAQSGLAVLMVSSDLPEVLALSDRVLVMRGGQIVRTFDRKDATAEGIIAAASGATLAEVTA
jgi:rhamnose transport system ATP-binding protein